MHLQNHGKWFPQPTRLSRRALSLLCAGALISGMLPLSLFSSAQRQGPLLSNFIMDKVCELDAVGGYPNDIGFSPQITNYTATAYLFQVYPFAQSDTAEVTVNGTQLNEQGYVTNAISFCFGDEGFYRTSEAQAFGKWFAWTCQHYPGVILHTNQYPNP